MGDWGTLPPADGNGTETAGRGETSGKLDTSGMARELADAKGDLLLVTPLHEGGSGDTNSSETDEESKESEERRGGMEVP